MAKKSDTATIRVVITDGGTAKLFSTNMSKATHSLNKFAFAANDKVDRELKGVAESSSNATKEFSKMSQGIGGLVHTYAIFAANVFAVSAAFRALSDAADYERMITASEQLSTHTGQNLVSMAKSMKAVSAGAIDMQTAMQSANLGAAAGFTANQMKELTKLATQAGIALGRSVPDAINRLITAVVKGEPELTDELGIILRLKEATEDYAKAHGKAVKDLTIGERSQAIYEQALARGKPKYSEISVDIQPFDKLAAVLTEVSKQLLGIVNIVVGPLAEGLANSKGIIIAIIALLGKMLLTKSTESFGAGLAERLYKSQEAMKQMNIETDKLVTKLNLLKAIKLDAKDFGMTLRKQTSMDELTTSLEEGIRNSLQRGIKGAKISKINVEKLAQSFMDNFSPTIRKQLPELIKQGVKIGAKAITIPDISGKLQTFEFKDTKGLGEFGKNIEDVNQVEEAVRRTKTIVGRLGIQVEKVGLGYKKWANTLKQARAGGFAAGLQQGLSQYQEGLKTVQIDIAKSTWLTQKWALATYKVSFAVAKVGKALNTVVSVISKITIVFAVLSIAWGVISKLLNIDTGNLTSAREKIEDITENLKLARKAAQTVTMDVDSLTEYKTELKKIINIGTQYVEVVSELGSAMDDMAKGSWFEKLRDGGEIAEEGTKELIKTWGNFHTIMSKTPEGVKALDKVIDSLNNKSFKLSKHIENVAESLGKLYAQRDADVTLLPKLQEGVIKEAVKTRIALRNEEIRLIQQAARVGTTAAQIEFKITKDKFAIHKKIAAGDQHGAKMLLERLQRLAEERGVTDAIQQIMQQIGVEMQNGLLILTQWTEEVRSMSSILDGVFKKFANFAGSKNALLISSLEEGISLNALEISKATDKEKKLAFANDILLANEQLKSIKKIASVDAQIAKRSFDTKVRYVDELSQKETLSLKDKKRALDTNQANALNNAKALATIEVGVAGAKRTLIQMEKTNDDNKINAAQKQLTAAESRRDILKEEGKIIDANRGKIEAESVRKKAKAGSKKSPVTKVSGLQAQIDLEKQKAIQAVLLATTKSLTNSYKDRAEAAKELLAIEEKMHQLRLGVIAGNIADAKVNRDKAKTTQDKLKAELQLQKALTAQATEKANQAQREYEARRKAHDLAKNATKESTPDISTLGKLWAADLTYAFQDMMLQMDSVITQLTTVTVNVLDGAARSIADALVDGTNNFAETISNVLRDSAKDLIADSMKMLGNLAFESISGLFTDTASAATEAAITTAATVTQTAALITSTGVQTGALLAGIVASTTAIVSAVFTAGAIPFAKGGILNHVNSYAGGHITSGAELAVIGEGRNNEAVVPLPDNKSIPVKITGGTGDTKVNTNIVINNNGEADTSDSETQGREGKRLGEMINLAIRRVLVDERRSGGILT